MKRILCRLLLLLVLFNSSELVSQSLLIEKFKLFEEKEDVVVSTFIVDHQNFIWFIANNRLYRFDGTNSEEMAPAFDGFDINTPKTLFFSLTNKIWITGIDKIGYFDLDQWSYHPVNLDGIELNNAINRIIYETEKGDLVFGYGEGQILVVTHGEVIVNDEIYQKSKEKQVRIGITSIAEFKDKLWIATTEGQLLEINPNDYSIVKSTQVTDQLSIEVVIPLKDEFLLELSNEGFYYYDFKRLKKEDRIDYERNVHLVKDSPLHMFYVDHKNLYMLNKLNDEHPIYKETLSKSLETLSQIILTQSHILLSNVEGIHSISVRNNGVYFVNPNPKFDKNSVRATYFFEDGAQFFCSYKGAGYIDESGILTHLEVNTIGYRIVPLDNNRLLLTSEGAFLEVFDRRTKTIYPYEYNTELSHRQIRENSYVTAITDDSDFYYLGSYGGILKLNKITHEVLKVDSNQKDLSYGIGVRELSLHEGELWVSTIHGLYVLKDKNWQKVYPMDRSETIHSHIRIKDTIWLATQSSGLVAINPKGELLENYTTKDGLTDNLIYQLDYREDKLFAFTAYGFNLYYNHTILPYYPKSQYENSEYNHGAIGYNPKTNTLYAGGIKGYTTIDLDGDIADVKFPTYVISEVVTSNKNNVVSTDYNHSYNNNSEIIIPKDNPYIRLKFKQNELDVNAVKYEYLIPELFEEWRKLDISKSIELVGISPGTYHLSVRHPGDRNFNNYLLKKEYYFYQSWWFYLLISLFIIVVVYSYFKFRVNLIQKNERLRSRIAADLHDDIGSVLGGILAQSQYANLAPEKTKSILSRIQYNAKTGLQSLSDIVWSVDHKNDNWDSFLDKIEVHGNESTQNSTIQFSLKTFGVPAKKALDQKLRQNLWLIFKESLMNCIKHSKATEFNVEITFNKHAVDIIISDNGIGFEQSTIQLGNGLKNMKMRSDLINAHFELISKPNNTQIRITAKL